MRFNVGLLVGTIVLSAEGGCKGSGQGGDSGVVFAPALPLSASAAPSVLPPGPAPSQDTGQPAAEALRTRPDLIEIVPGPWRDRISATITGDRPESACPALKLVTGSDEFARKEARESALALCNGDNQKALAFGKTCPLAATFDVRMSDYDFDAKRFTIEAPSHGSSDTVLVSSRGRVYLPDGHWLLTWSGPRVRAQGGCVGALNDAVPGLAGFALDLPMSEDDARALHGRLQGIKGRDKRIEVAFLAAGTVAAEDVACGMKIPISAEGAALAWRLLALPDSGVWGSGPDVVLIDWSTVSRWQPTPLCDGEQGFYGLEPGALGKSAKVVKTQCPTGTRASGGNATGCTCWQDTSQVGIAPRPQGECEQRPISSGSDCIWRCK